MSLSDEPDARPPAGDRNPVEPGPPPAGGPDEVPGPAPGVPPEPPVPGVPPEPAPERAAPGAPPEPAVAGAPAEPVAEREPAAPGVPPEAAAEGERDRDATRALARDLDVVQRGRPERAFNVGAALGVLVAVAAAIFVVQNNRSTDFEWLWFDFELPLWTALVGAVLAGVVLVVTALAVHHRRQRRIHRRREAGGRLRQALGDEPEDRPSRRWFRFRRPAGGGPMQA